MRQHHQGESPTGGSRHHFVIGPQRATPWFSRPARIYYCFRCKWSYLVCGAEVVVVDEDGHPLDRDESAKRFNSFADEACPVFNALALEDRNPSRDRVGNLPRNLVDSRHRKLRFSSTDQMRPSLRMLFRTR